MRVPSLIILLPAGFTAGALTDVVHPDQLAPDFNSLVSLAVAVILYDAGLGLELPHLKGETRSVVLRLIALGTPITWGACLGLIFALFDVPFTVAVMTGVILVVSGPTVVGPILEHVRPTDRLRRILTWEGSLIDPVGGILGAVVFHVIVRSKENREFRFGIFVGGVAVGLIGGMVGLALLWPALRRLRLGGTLGTLAQLASVVAVSAGCDMVFDDTGLIAAIVMGITVANLPGFDMPARRPFFETVVELTIGLLFISISATVEPKTVAPVILPSLALIAVLVVVVRPLVALCAAARTDLGSGERGSRRVDGAPRHRRRLHRLHVLDLTRRQGSARRRQDPPDHLPRHRGDGPGLRVDGRARGRQARRLAVDAHPAAARRRKLLGDRSRAGVARGGTGRADVGRSGDGTGADQRIGHRTGRGRTLRRDHQPASHAGGGHGGSPAHR
ncbi:hypothetical protein [Streptomyces sp. MN13]